MNIEGGTAGRNAHGRNINHEGGQERRQRDRSCVSSKHAPQRCRSWRVRLRPKTGPAVPRRGTRPGASAARRECCDAMSGQRVSVRALLRAVRERQLTADSACSRTRAPVHAPATRAPRRRCARDAHAHHATQTEFARSAPRGRFRRKRAPFACALTRAASRSRVAHRKVRVPHRRTLQRAQTEQHRAFFRCIAAAKANELALPCAAAKANELALPCAAVVRVGASWCDAVPAGGARLVGARNAVVEPGDFASSRRVHAQHQRAAHTHVRRFGRHQQRTACGGHPRAPPQSRARKARRGGRTASKPCMQAPFHDTSANADYPPDAPAPRCSLSERGAVSALMAWPAAAMAVAATVTGRVAVGRAADGGACRRSSGAGAKLARLEAQTWSKTAV
jgi:hypothetical protein